MGNTLCPSPTDYRRLPEELELSEDKNKRQNRKLTVHIYASEYAKIKNWVLLHQDIETGGDLFGLWRDSHTAVVQLALGPGENCRRYATSFFQDLDYLATAGGYLTKKHGLCNLGQWHSHHQLSLNRPSHGDENTVWSHMPSLALNRYIVCIANISKEWNSRYRARVNCFLFELDDEGRQLPVLKGKFHHLKQQSPMNEDSQVMQVTAEGAESIVESVASEPESDSDEEDSTTPSSWNVWSKWKECIRSNTGKVLIIIGLLTVIFIVVGSMFLFMSLDNESKHNKSPTTKSVTGNNTSV